VYDAAEAAVRQTAWQTAAVLQSVSESIQNRFKFRLTFHKSTEEVAPWLEQCKNTDHKAVVFRKYLLVFAFTGSALQ
jgi:hypothetical protein